MSEALRKAAEQALEALDVLVKKIERDAPDLSGKSIGFARQSSDELRTALEAALKPVGYVRMLNGEPTPDDDGHVFSYGENPYRDAYGNEEWVPVSVASPLPPAEPRISTEHCSLAERQSHQASVNYPSDDLYCPRCQCSERFLQSRQCEPHIVYDAPPPAEVPLLTPGEVALMWVSESLDTMSYESCYTRGVKRGEQVVRRNAGLK